MTASPAIRPAAADETAVIVKAVTRAADFWALRNGEAAALFDLHLPGLLRHRAGQSTRGSRRRLNAPAAVRRGCSR